MDAISIPFVIFGSILFIGVPLLFVWDLGIVVCLIIDLIRSKRGHSVHILGMGLAVILVALGFTWDSLGPFREHGSIKYIPIPLVIAICTVPVLYFVYHLNRFKGKRLWETVVYALVASYSAGAAYVWCTSSWN